MTGPRRNPPPSGGGGRQIETAETPDELLADARGAELQAAIHSRIARIAEEGAEETEDEQVRIGVLAWAQDVARSRRLAARASIDLSRELYDRAARAL